MRQTRFLTFVLLVAVWIDTTRAQFDVNTLLAKSDPIIQVQIESAVNALLGLSQSKPRTNVEGTQELKKLSEIADEDETIVEQLAIYAVKGTDEESQHDLKASLVLTSLDLKPSLVIRVLAPYLDADNAQLRGFAELWFGSHDNAAAARPRSPLLQPVNYEDYFEYVRRQLSRGEDIPPGFTEYIYERSPGRALLVFAYASGGPDAVARLKLMRDVFEARQQGRVPEPQDEAARQLEARGKIRSKARHELELAEHIVSDAIWLNENRFRQQFQNVLPQAVAELAKLAKHEEWWVRLYVAQIMQQHPEMRDPAVIEQFQKDSNALVSKAATPAKE